MYPLPGAAVMVRCVSAGRSLLPFLGYVYMRVVRCVVVICLAIYMRVCGTTPIYHDFLRVFSARPRASCAAMKWSGGIISNTCVLILKWVCIGLFFDQWGV